MKKIKLYSRIKTYFWYKQNRAECDKGRKKVEKSQFGESK